MENSKIKILAISGSLRKASSNTALLRAAASLAPFDVEIVIYEGIGNLPLFSPDYEGNEPSSVLHYREALKTVDGVMIASPEYAHGVTGAIKNALDWVVASGEIVGKPVCILNAAPRAKISQESLREIIRTIDARVIEKASLTIPLPHNRFDTAAILEQPEFCTLLKLSIAELMAAIEASRKLEACP